MLTSLSTFINHCKQTLQSCPYYKTTRQSAVPGPFLNYFYSIHTPHSVSCMLSWVMFVLHLLSRSHSIYNVIYLFSAYRSWRAPSLFWASWSRRQETSAKPQSPGGRSTNGSKRSLNSHFDHSAALDSALNKFRLHAGLFVIYLIYCKFLILINVFITPTTPHFWQSSLRSQENPKCCSSGWKWHTVFTFVQVFYLLSFHLYKYDITLSFYFFFLFAQIIDNNFTVSTSAVMSIYRRGGKVKGGTRWSFYHRVATVWPTQTAHFATGVDEMEKHCGERERERPHVHFRSQVVCLYVHVISNRKVLAGVVEDDQWRFSHNPLCLFLVLQFTERQRAKGSQRE